MCLSRISACVEEGRWGAGWEAGRRGLQEMGSRANPAHPAGRPGSLWSGKKASGLEADPHHRPPQPSCGGPGSHPHFRSEPSVGPSRASRTPCSALPGEAGAGRKRPAGGPRLPSLEGAHGSGRAPDVPAPSPSITELSPRNVLQTRSPREEAPGRLRSPARPLSTHPRSVNTVPPSQPGPVTLLSSWTWAPAQSQPSPKEPWPPPARWRPWWWWGGTHRSRPCSPSLESRQPVQPEPRANSPPRPKWQYCCSGYARCSRAGQPGEQPLSPASPGLGQLGGRQRPRVGPTLSSLCPGSLPRNKVSQG